MPPVATTSSLTKMLFPCCAHGTLHITRSTKYHFPPKGHQRSPLVSCYSRFQGKTQNRWFGSIHFFRCDESKTVLLHLKIFQPWDLTGLTSWWWSALKRRPVPVTLTPLPREVHKSRLPPRCACFGKRKTLQLQVSIAHLYLHGFRWFFMGFHVGKYTLRPMDYSMGCCSSFEGTSISCNE